MGNAMTAIVDDWSSVYYNIGGLGKTVHLRTTHTPEGGGEEVEEFFPNQTAINYFYTTPQFYINIPQRSYRPAIGGSPVPLSTDAAKGLDFHAMPRNSLDLIKVIKFPDIVSSARCGIAMTFTNLGYAIKANDVDFRTHDFLRYGREAQK